MNLPQPKILTHQFLQTMRMRNCSERTISCWRYILNRFVAQPAQAGAVPMVLAAAGTEAQPGGFYGPQKGGEMRGPVSDASAGEQALDKGMQARLWAESERLVEFEWKPMGA